MADQDEYQIPLSEQESRRLAQRVMTDYRNAQGDHVKRIDRFRGYMRRWRLMVDDPAPGDEENSNYPVPVTKWYTSQKWAENADSIFGDDAQVEAQPVGPSDYKTDKKVSLYMTWRVFKSMSATAEFLKLELYTLLFGRAHAYSPWKRESYDIVTPQGKEKTIEAYKGPGFEVLDPDDFVVPAEDAKTLHDFSWIIRRVRLTPEQLLLGEERGTYRNIKKNFAQILRIAHRANQRDYEGDEVKRERDNAEGVSRESPLSSGNTVLMLEWYGRWRPLKKGKKDADEYDIDQRQLHEEDLVVRILPDVANLEIGVQDLRRLYPAAAKPRPFVERSHLKDGSYWCEGVMEQLEDTEDEVRSNHNKGTDAQDLVLFPPMFYRPSSGFNIGKFKYGPGEAIPADNPQSDMAQMKITANLESIMVREQALLAYGERLIGVSDMSMGRQPDRPNAPKTARGTMALLAQGNLRQVIDVVSLREDYKAIFDWFWTLERMFSDEETFFRVTEEDAGDLFPTKGGGSYLQQKDRDGRYDFILELATSIWSREADKENALALYQLDMQNPIVMQNPSALWHALKNAHEALGDPNFADLIPEPPHPDVPLNPQHEWSLIQRGETVHVNPMDNDQLHMQRHIRDLQTAIANKYDDQDALLALRAHYIEHIHQLESKMAVQAIAEGLARQASQLGMNPMGPGGAMSMGGMPTGILAPPGGADLPPSPMPIPGSVAPENLHPFAKKQPAQQPNNQPPPEGGQ